MQLQEFSTMCSARPFIDLGFVFRVVTHFELTFEYTMLYG
jgi:hypothetical protein